MTNLMNSTMNLANILAEDSGLMELRSPLISGIRKQGRLKKIFRKAYSYFDGIPGNR